MTAVAGARVEQAVLWRMLSLGFAVPRPEAVDEVEVLAEALESDSPLVADVLVALHRTNLDSLTAEYLRLFGGSVQVSPYEGSYEVDPIRQGRQMADVAAFYGAFGARAHGPAAERPDHVGCELEFLAFLELRRLAAEDAADDERAALLDEIAASFLRDHAGRWLPAFFTQVEASSAPASVYRALAALGAHVLDTELAGRGLEVDPAPRTRPRTAVEDDGFGCAASSTAASPARG